MVQSYNKISVLNTTNKILNDKNNFNFNNQEYLKDNNFIFGYTASLLTVMNGTAKVILVSERVSKEEREILANNCKITSIPLIEIEYIEKNTELRDLFPSGVEVLALVK
jgi:ribosomal protein L30E